MFARSPHRCLLVGLLVAATALGGCASDKKTAGPSCDRPDGAFDAAATRLEFRMQAADRVRVDEARRILCERLGPIGVDHRVRATGDGLTVDVPRESAQGDPDGHSLVFGVGELAFYDWEPNVIGPGGTPAPRDPDVTGGVAAGETGGTSLYAAVLRASKRPAATEADNARASSRFYAVDAKARRVFAGRTVTSPQLGSPTRAAALALAPARLRDAAKVYEVKPDTVILRTSTQPARHVDETREWFALRDDVALRGSHIVDPAQRFSEGPGGTGEPVVTFDFTAAGRQTWERVTREIADRGRAVAALPAADASSANQHFAIVIDDALLSVPYIDFRQNPDGIDGRTGSQIQGGLTIASAREVAVLLKGEPLPAPLVLVGRSAVK